MRVMLFRIPGEVQVGAWLEGRRPGHTFGPAAKDDAHFARQRPHLDLPGRFYRQTDLDIYKPSGHASQPLQWIFVDTNADEPDDTTPCL
jgi:hypothetical protein